MAVLVDQDTRVVIQGVTGRLGRFVLKDLLAYGTHVVAGVSLGHGGEVLEGVPVFESVAEAVSCAGANTALIMVAGYRGYEAVLEAAAAGIRLAVWVSDPVPLHDMMRLRWSLPAGFRLVGPNTPGVISPGKSKVGFMPSHCYRPGPVGVISRSGSLSYEVCLRLSTVGIGQSTAVGVGGDPIKGLDMVEVLSLFDSDPETRVILVLGEVGGRDEYRVADAVREGRVSKPVVGFLVGREAPAGRKLGHAGAFISSDEEGYWPKLRYLEASGVKVVRSLRDISGEVRGLLNGT